MSTSKIQPDYEARIAQQVAVVNRLAEENAKNPTPATKLQLAQKSDALLHLRNLVKGDPKERARAAAAAARDSALSKAITQPLKTP